MQQTTKDNHYIPKLLLRRWADAESYLCAYRLLVPRPDFPIWERRHIASVAKWQHLYTTVQDGLRADEFERWIKDDFEDPAVPALERLWKGEPPSESDSHVLGGFVACLDVRTPTAYQEMRRRFDANDGAVLEATLRKTVARLESGTRKRRKKIDRVHELPLTVATEVKEGEPWLRVEMISGRQSWLFTMEQVLKSAVRSLRKQHWSVALPHGESKWFIPDHPVVRLWWNGYEDYGFGGGWGAKGSEIMLPISPRLLLYTRVGERNAPVFTFGREQTLNLQYLFAKRATRWIFADESSRRVPMLRRRHVDLDQFRDEEGGQAAWHGLHGGSTSPLPGGVAPRRREIF